MMISDQSSILFSGVSLEEGLRTAQVKQAPLGHIKPMWPMLCVGLHAGLALILIGEYGTNTTIPAGGGIRGHPDRYMAGAKAWQQAIAGSLSEQPFLEYAKKPENKERRNVGTFSSRSHVLPSALAQMDTGGTVPHDAGTWLLMPSR
jgi:hypothetical protein